MAPKIDKRLLPLKIHYFFKYGGIAFFPLLPVVVRQKGIPATGVGLIWTVTPLSSCAINLMTSALADAYKIYRTVFLIGMAVFSVSFLSIFLLTDSSTPKTTGPYNNGTIEPVSQCFTNETHLDSFGASDWLFFRDCDNLNSTDWFKKLGGDSECALHCNYSSETEQGALNYSRSFRLHETLNMYWNTDEMNLYDICENSEWTAVNKANANISLPVPQPSVNLCEWSFTDIPCSTTCHDPILHQSNVKEESSVTQLLQRPIFWMIFILLLLVYGGNSSTTTMADTICFSLLGSARHKYGRQRLWGSLGWGLVGFTSAALVSVFSQGQESTNYTPALIISAIFLGINFLVALRIPFKMPDKEKLKATHVGKALCTSNMIVYLATVITGGLNMGIVWTFLFIITEEVAIKWDPDFHHQKLLQGLMIGTSCFLGEVPSLFLSSVILKKLGNIKTFALSLVGFTIRVLLYSAVVNPWYFIPIDLFHGLSFGMFYPTMISYASLMAPKGAQATVQGIVKSLFIVGVSLGGLAGGLMVTAVGGSITFRYLGIFDAAYTVFFILAQLAIHRRGKPEDGHGDYSTPDHRVDEIKNNGLDMTLGMAEQGSMCDLQVTTPYHEVAEDQEKLEEKSDV